MITTRLYGPCWVRRERPTLIGRTTQTVPHGATDTGTVKPEPRESFAACRTDYGSSKLKKCSSTPTLVTSRCCTALSMPSMALQEVENSPLTPADGSTTMKDKEGIRARWEEHFNQFLNQPSTVDQKALQQIRQKPLFEDPDLPPHVDEVKTAIKEMNSGKTPGADGIPAELYKVIGTTAFKAFHDILVSIWEEECMPADFRDATIATLYKNTGTKSDCGNYRGISLLSIAGKILAHILLDRLFSSVSESTLPEA